MGIDHRTYGDLPEDYYSNQRQDMLPYLPKDARIILDIGCGEGDFGELIKRQSNAEVWGIELSSQAAEKARVRLDRVYEGNIELDQFDLPEEYFDCIVFNDVLEHLWYPWDVLKQMRKLLKNHGYVLASIPNIRYLGQVKKLMLQGDWDYEPWGILDRTHLRFFTLKSVKKLFEQTGYTVMSIEGKDSIGFRWKFYLLNMLLGKRLEDMRYLRFACLARK